MRGFLKCQPVARAPNGLDGCETTGLHNSAYEYLAKVQECIETLMAHGTDRYGKIKAPILVSIIEVSTRNCPENPEKLDEYFRVNRRGRRSPGGSNLLTDQPTLTAMYTLTDIVGNAAYADFADRYASYVMTHLVDEQGFFWWGFHRHYDVFTDGMAGHNPNMAKWGLKVVPHEFHLVDISWDRLWAANREAVKKEVDAIWKWHVVDKASGEVNRHGDGTKGCDFTMSGGSCIEAFVFMYAQTKEPEWLARAKRVADYYWERRDPKTSLVPDRPNAGNKRFDGSCFVTSITGLYCHSLLKAFELTGDEAFRDQALTYLRAYAKYGFDPESGKYWGAIRMDGTPIPGPRIYTDNIDSAEGYAAAQPRGHLDLWEPYIAGYQYPIYTARAYVDAYHLTHDPDMLMAAKRFAAWIRKTPPGTVETKDTWYREYSEGPGRKGTYAGKYGRTISFYLKLYAATAEFCYLEDARELADNAIGKLYHNGLFRGHPAKPYYEAIDGVGELLNALLELDQVLTHLPAGDVDGAHYLMLSRTNHAGT